MSAKRPTLKCRLSYILAAIIIIFGLFIINILHELGEHIVEISRFKGREAANNIILDAVDLTLESYPCDTLYTALRDSDGRILSVQIDPAKANQVKNSIIRNVENGLEELGEDGIKIPIGTLSGITYLSGKGAKLNIDLHQMGAVDSELVSNFESAGINQTRLRITVLVKVEISAVLPNGSADIKVNDEYLLCETIIVGEVPQLYMGE